MNVRLLAQVPLVMSVGQAADAGTPIALEESVASHEFLHLAREVADAVAERNSTLPPTLKVEMKK